jgi:multiple sugar transport system permease protein
MIRGFIMSFQRLHRGETTWVGWANYQRVWHDPSFGTAWRNTLIFTALALVLGFAVPFFVAILLNELRHARGYLRVLVYLPVILAPASGLLLFKFLYYPSQAGIFNYVLHALHLPMSQFSQSPNVLTTQLSLVVASTWLNMGSATLIYIAALQSIPGELYEAAELDGAGIWRRIRTVTIPQTRLILSLMFLLQIVATMQVYVEPLILAGGNGSEDSALGLVYLIYQHAFNFNDFNGAAAIGVMMLIVLGSFSGLYAYLNRDRG